MSFSLIIGAWLLTFGICLLAWTKGGAAERQGALLVLAISVLTALAVLLPTEDLRRPCYLILDGLLGLGLLRLALRHTSAWLGLAMLLQAAQFSLHAYYLVADKRYGALYATVNNVVTFGVLACLLTGTLLAWRRRRRGAPA